MISYPGTVFQNDQSLLIVHSWHIAINSHIFKIFKRKLIETDKRSVYNEFNIT